MRRFDVVVVGGGVAGATTAAVLASAGHEVLIVERDTAFRDRVRGEYLAPWGLAEVAELGLTDVVMSVPYANVLTEVTNFDETLPVDETITRSFAGLVPGIPGSLGIGHPGLSEAVLAHAGSCGAEVLRGVERVAVAVGTEPSVVYDLGGQRHEVGCRLVVGADGRESTVRRQLGWRLQSTQPRVQMGGLLVDGTEAWPRHLVAIGIEDDVHFLVFPQAEGRTRVYLAWDANDPHRFSGPGKERRFLEALRRRCLPQGDVLADATPVGPLASFPMTDTWLDTPVAEGVVLVGDAAGWSDPLYGQGLSVSLRDARLVGEALAASSSWTPEVLTPYVEERAERMRRLRFTIRVMHLTHHFGPEAQDHRRRIRALVASDPALGAYYAAGVVGPWCLPEAAFTEETYETLARVDVR
jgi:2-polyprenyl-6-methoxyphenol hydroxylase-like FAD-dependent oxidoreductase